VQEAKYFILGSVFTRLCPLIVFLLYSHIMENLFYDDDTFCDKYLVVGPLVSGEQV